MTKLLHLGGRRATAGELEELDALLPLPTPLRERLATLIEVVASSFDELLEAASPAAS